MTSIMTCLLTPQINPATSASAPSSFFTQTCTDCLEVHSFFPSSHSIYSAILSKNSRLTKSRGYDEANPQTQPLSLLQSPRHLDLPLLAISFLVAMWRKMTVKSWNIALGSEAIAQTLNSFSADYCRISSKQVVFPKTIWNRLIAWPPVMFLLDSQYHHSSNINIFPFLKKIISYHNNLH